MGLVYGLCDQRGKNPLRSPAIAPIGDSITYGVNAATLAGWREPLYFLGQAGGTGLKFTFVGTQSFAGNGGGLAVDPANEGYPGYAVRVTAPPVAGSLIERVGNVTTLIPQVCILSGGTNDIAILGDSAATVASSISDWMDVVWERLRWSWGQIVVCTILKRLDAFDATVQAVNALLPAVVAGKSYVDSVTLIDMYASILDPTIGTGGYNDDVHPNDEGYTDMATALWAGGLQTVLGRCR